MTKVTKKVGLDSRSQGRRNVQGTVSTSVGRRGDKRDQSAIRKEKIQIAKDEKEKQVLNAAALDVQQMFQGLCQQWDVHKVPDQHK